MPLPIIAFKITKVYRLPMGPVGVWCPSPLPPSWPIFSPCMLASLSVCLCVCVFAACILAENTPKIVFFWGVAFFLGGGGRFKNLAFGCNFPKKACVWPIVPGKLSLISGQFSASLSPLSLSLSLSLSSYKEYQRTVEKAPAK